MKGERCIAMEPAPTEELLERCLAPRGDVYDQSVLLGSAFLAAEAGESVVGLADRFEGRYGIMSSGKVSMGAMVLTRKI